MAEDGESNYLDSWPEPCNIADYSPSIDLSSLPIERKQQAWRWIKEKHPSLALLLTDIYRESSTDKNSNNNNEIEILKELIQQFNSTVLVELKYLPPGFDAELP